MKLGRISTSTPLGRPSRISMLGVFPSHWLEMVKRRLYDGDKVAAWTIHRIVRDTLAMFSPICPLFSHHISTTFTTHLLLIYANIQIRYQFKMKELLHTQQPLLLNSIQWSGKRSRMQDQVLKTNLRNRSSGRADRLH